MNLIPKPHNLATAKNTPERKIRRKIAREVAAAYDALLRAGGFEPGERRTAWAIDCQLYELDSQAPDTPRRIPLSSIGAALTSKSDDAEARAKTASRHVGQLFNHAIPRYGYQILTRFKSPEESGSPHEYASHAMPVAEILAELHTEERAKILADRTIERRRQAIEDSLERLAAEALELLPRCEVEILDPDGATYAYVSAPEAKAYCKSHEDFSARPLTYTPPAGPEEKPTRKPLYGADFKRLKDRAVRQAIDSILDEIVERNSFEEARLFLRTELLPALNRAAESWTKVEGGRETRERREEEEEEQEELNHVSDLSGVPPQTVIETGKKTEEVPPPKLSGVPADKSPESNDLQKAVFETFENDAPILTGSENFDGALEAALFYARDGWNVIPICQWDSNKSRCTHAKHPADCGGRKPLVKGDGSGGYTAATTDKDKIQKWWGGEFKDAGVGIRLDAHINIDCDIKDGGLESYEYLRDTFDLPETLTQITQSGGRHYVFKLPDDLPADWLKSWTRVGDKVALGGIDLKVGDRGLLFAEPTIGSKGVYRWIDPTVEPAELPRTCADFLHAARYKDEEQKAEKRQASRVYSSSDQPREFDPEQAKYFRDVAEGDRHKRLFAVAVAISKQTGAGADKIVAALNYHASHFSTPLDDQPWIDRVAATLGGGR